MRFIFCVPSGNFGNLTAGVYAWQWGLPAKAFIAATNINDVVPQYIRSGIFSPRKSMATISNAMDVGNPSNFERLTAIFSANHGKMKELISGYTVTDDTTRGVMEEFLSRYGFLIDPHTAVGYEGALRFREKNGEADTEIVILGTAHPAKFPETVKEATGKTPELPDSIRESLLKPKESILLDNSTASLKAFLLTSFG